MSEEKALTIIKSAILLEKRGQSLYQQVADQAKEDEVRDFFLEMVDDEKCHAEILAKQFEYFRENERFDHEVNDYYTTNSVEEILNPNLKDLIEAASYEAAAITAAIGMEKNAVDLYSARAGEATDPAEKLLYAWLAKWEQTHLDQLVELDEQLQENIWYDNGFWPM